MPTTVRELLGAEAAPMTIEHKGKLWTARHLDLKFMTEIETYLQGLVSPNLPSAQRIVGYDVDAVSQNTPELTALGIFVIQTKVRLLPSMDDIIFNTQIGETVVLDEAA